MDEQKKHNFGFRMTPTDRKAWGEAAKLDGFDNVSDWVRVTVRKRIAEQRKQKKS